LQREQPQRDGRPVLQRLELLMEALRERRWRLQASLMRQVLPRREARRLQHLSEAQGRNAYGGLVPRQLKIGSTCGRQPLARRLQR
jgi:hypothetical protein